MRRNAARAGAALVCAAVLAALIWQGARGRPGTADETPVVRQAGFAMGTFVQVVAAGPNAEAAARAAVEEVRRLGRLLDRFDPASPVAKVNAAAGHGAVAVPPELAELVELALELARATGGAFDPTVGPLMDVWGFGAGFRSSPPVRPPDAEAVEAARRRVGFEGLRVEREGARARVGLDRAGMVLDLGGIAQGYAADRALEVLRRHGVRQGLVDVGGEVAALGGRPGGSGRAEPEGWRVGIQHPRAADRLVATVHLRDRAAGTSGDYQRYFEYEGRRFSHIIDPATGYPASGLVSATVLHSRAAVADALATAVMVLGPERGAALIRRWPGAEAILVDAGLRVIRVTGP